MIAKKYYWLKLKEGFFEEDTIEWLEEQENGVYYTNFYLKLCLKSLKTNGILIRKVGEILIPYDIKKLSEMTRVKIDTVIVAMELFKKIGLVQILEHGEIYLTQLELMVGSETSKAQIMRNKRAREKNEVKGGNNVTRKLPGVTNELPTCYTEKDKELEKDIETEQELKKEINKDSEKDTDRDKEIKTEQRNLGNKQSGSSCDDYIDKSKNVIGNDNVNCLNYRDEIAIDMEENPIDAYRQYRSETEDMDNIYNASDKINKNDENENIDIMKYFEKCGFAVNDKLKEFIEEDIKKYGRKLVTEAADECVRKGKSNNYGYLTGILQNWITEGKEENKNCKARANTSAYKPMISILDE